MAILDAWGEVIPIALNYLGLDTASVKKTDLDQAEKLLMSIRPYIRHFQYKYLIYSSSPQHTVQAPDIQFKSLAYSTST